MDPKRVLPTPDMPSQLDIDKHREDHCPYQSGSEACVESFGRDAAHITVDIGARTVPMIAFDYLFVNDKGVSTRSEVNEKGESGGVTVFVFRDCKGVGDRRYAVDMVCEDRIWLGFTRVFLTSDNEPDTVNLAVDTL